ncbi:MFS transporter [Mycolicibacterium tusciae]|uniref:MFS transporter n=1 Tax=Mycolicibacterium tusciae TaxID=75922 RepID=A0A1X0JRM8_9MYCO|nr:MFS transporter [Mycolicibacterium tusciae]ORB65491.1 MFS transporter [Mycolicibacterium tusciae]
MRRLTTPDVGRTRHPAVVVAVLATTGTCMSLMQTLVIPLIPELPKLLNTNASNASWVITATLLVAAVATPVVGRLGDMYGPKRLLIACAILMTLGSLIAASTSAWVPVVIGRALQGFGVPIVPLGISVLRTCVPAHRVGTAMGLMSASLGVGGALGLPLAAIIADHFDWHAVFWFAAILGAMSGVLFAVLVPRIPAAASSDRLDPLGALGLAAGLVTLLLGISKGGSWGWGSATTLAMFAAAIAIFAMFGWWQLRIDSPMVDMRTTVKRPVLMTNVASVAVGFAMFALALIGPQVLELPVATGYGLGLSMVEAGLWLAPGGLAMMVASPVASRIAAARGPRFTLTLGCAIIAASYLAGFVLLGGAWQLCMFNVLVSVGVGFAYSSLPALINAAVPMSETAAANGINALARALGTSISSAVVGAVLTGLTISIAGQEFPSLTAFRISLLIAAGMAILAGVLAALIPVTDADQDRVPAEVGASTR